MISEHERWMRAALEEAACGDHWTSPNPMVGAILVRHGVEVGRGHHRRAGQPHAEVLALRAAGEAARGATLYVTLEPCAHHGRTPPCVDAVLAAGVTRVVVGMADPNPRVAGGGVRRLRDAGVEVLVPVLEPEARRLNEFWLHHLAHGVPFVTAKFAASLDGRVATGTGESRWITGAEARAYGHELRHRHQAILVGAGTVRADDPELTTRRADGREGRDPLRVVLDSRLDLPLRARVFAPAAAGARTPVVAALAHAPAARQAAFRAAGVEILVVPADSAGRPDLRAVLAALGTRGVQSVLAEGGPAVLGACFDAGLVDAVAAFIAPRIIGGAQAPAAVGGAGVAALADAPSLRQSTVARLGPDLLVTGYCGQH